VTGPVDGTATGSVAAVRPVTGPTAPSAGPPDEPLWTPREGLVADVRHAIALAPRDTAQARFEAWAWRAMLDEDGAALLTRHAAPSHLTSSAVVLSRDGRRTCLVLHGKFDAWVQPGGHLEAGDLTLALAAAREVEEETGLTGVVLPRVAALSRHVAPCRPEVDWHLDVQHVLVADDVEPVVSEESRDVRWWAVDALPGALAPELEDTLRRARAVLADAG
jgi:8-oxo-dGTP pyrophosphatase MutT (NUDIX family)